MFQEVVTAQLEIRMANPVDLRYVRALALSEDRKEYPLDTHANHFAAYSRSGDFIGGASLAVVQWRRLGSQLIHAFNAEPSARVAWLYGVGVMPEHRGMGYATEILGHATRLARYSFAQQMALVARNTLLYERVGMQCVGSKFQLASDEALSVYPMICNLDVLELP